MIYFHVILQNISELEAMERYFKFCFAEKHEIKKTLISDIRVLSAQFFKSAFEQDLTVTIAQSLIYGNDRFKLSDIGFNFAKTLWKRGRKVLLMYIDSCLPYEIASTYRVLSKQKLSVAIRSVLDNNIIPSTEDLIIMERAFITESAGHR